MAAHTIYMNFKKVFNLLNRLHEAYKWNRSRYESKLEILKKFKTAKGHEVLVRIKMPCKSAFHPTPDPGPPILKLQFLFTRSLQKDGDNDLLYQVLGSDCHLRNFSIHVLS